MYEFLENYKLIGKVFVLTAKHELMGNPKDLANLIWQVEKLHDEYDELWYKIIHLQKDPCLPSELLPRRHNIFNMRLAR